MKQNVLLSVFLTLLLCTTGEGFAQLDYMPSAVITERSDLTKKLAISLEKQKAQNNRLSGKYKTLANKYMDDRQLLIKDMLKNGAFIFDTPLNAYLEGIFREILVANPSIDPETMLLLSRSGNVNAFTTGDGFFVLNLGILLHMNTRDEIAFVMGHELSHQSLDHSNKAIQAQVATVLDPERKKEIDRILKSEYQIGSQLEGLLIPGLMASMQHSRSAEFAADSLGMLYVQNTKLNPNNALRVIQILDSSDAYIYKQNIPWQGLYEQSSCTGREVWNEVNASNSSLGTFNIEEKYDRDLLKSHPDCDKRLIRLMELFNLTVEAASVDPEFEKIRLMARIELIESYRVKSNYGMALYHTLHLYLEQPDLQYARETSAQLFGLIGLLKKERNLGQYVEMESQYQTSDYSHFLKVLWEMTSKETSCIGYNMIKTVPAPLMPERHLYVEIMSAYVLGNAEEAKLKATEYKKTYSKGIYIERVNRLFPNK